MRRQQKMGLFLNVLIVRDSKEKNVKQILEKMGDSYSGWNLIPEDCKCQEFSGGTAVLLNEMCASYDGLPRMLSEELCHPVMLCYIYDGDFWGYSLYDNGMELDNFNPIPDYFGDVSEREKKQMAGNSRLIAEYFNVKEDRIKNYLQQWTDELLDSDEKIRAYEEDEFCIGEDWQMADFMKALGFPYTWQ